MGPICIGLSPWCNEDHFRICRGLSHWFEKVGYANGQLHWNINKDSVHRGAVHLGLSWFVALVSNVSH